MSPPSCTPRAGTSPTTAKDDLVNINERCLVTFLERHLINIQEPVLRRSAVGDAAARGRVQPSPLLLAQLARLCFDFRAVLMLSSTVSRPEASRKVREALL